MTDLFYEVHVVYQGFRHGTLMCSNHVDIEYYELDSENGTYTAHNGTLSYSAPVISYSEKDCALCPLIFIKDVCERSCPPASCVTCNLLVFPSYSLHASDS